MIKVLICDGDGTLRLPNTTPDILSFMNNLPGIGIELAVASNKPEWSVRKKFSDAGLILPRFTITPQDVGVKKASPEFVYRIQQLSGASLEQIAFLGDDDKSDIFCAINAGILPFAAQYSNPNIKYGLKVSEPKVLWDFLRTFGIQNTYFGWTYQSACPDTKTSIDIRVLINEHQGLTEALKTVLKDQGQFLIGTNKIPLQAIIFLYLVSQVYLSGLSSQLDLITVYPGHLANSRNVLLEDYSSELAPIFRDRFIPDLLVRHRDAPESKRQGEHRNIFDQFQTIHVNSAYQQRIQGRRILVLDDFTTYGYSLETARRMLIQAGAGHVVGLAVAKYRRQQAVTHIPRNWNPYQPCTLTQGDISVNLILGTSNPSADQHFHNVIRPVYSK